MVCELPLGQLLAVFSWYPRPIPTAPSEGSRCWSGPSNRLCPRRPKPPAWLPRRAHFTMSSPRSSKGQARSMRWSSTPIHPPFGAGPTPSCPRSSRRPAASRRQCRPDRRAAHRQPRNRARRPRSIARAARFRGARASTRAPWRWCRAKRAKSTRWSPLFGSGSRLLLAMADPTDLDRHLPRPCACSGVDVEPALAHRAAHPLRPALERTSDLQAASPRPSESSIDDEDLAREHLAQGSARPLAAPFRHPTAIQLVRAMPEIASSAPRRPPQPDRHRARIRLHRPFVCRAFTCWWSSSPALRRATAKHAISAGAADHRIARAGAPASGSAPSTAGARALEGPIRR